MMTAASHLSNSPQGGHTAAAGSTRPTTADGTAPIASVTGSIAAGSSASGADQPVLTIDELHKYFGNPSNLTRALNGISFTVHRGEFVAIMGPSGCGKTTLLNCISTIDRASSGHVYLQGTDITTLGNRDVAAFRGKQLGFVFQDANLLDTLTIGENIALALTINRVAPREIRPRVAWIAEQLNIADTLERFPYQVSGGQRQRAAAARALVTEPSLVLADEPTGALDSANAHTLLQSFQRVNRDLGATIIMVTHDALAASFTQRVLFMKDGILFNELRRGSKTRTEFFDDILRVVSILGGEVHDA